MPASTMQRKSAALMAAECQDEHAWEVREEIHARVEAFLHGF
jgi:hypothetical protein